MGRSLDPMDPRGLIRDSYRIEGIGPAECRSVFLDWAMGLPPGTDADTARQGLLARYEADHPDHPMTAVLAEGAGDTAPKAPRRRGGWRARERGPAKPG